MSVVFVWKGAAKKIDSLPMRVGLTLSKHMDDLHSPDAAIEVLSAAFGIATEELELSDWTPEANIAYSGIIRLFMAAMKSDDAESPKSTAPV